MPAGVVPAQEVRRSERFNTSVKGWYVPEGQTVGRQVQVLKLSEHGAKLQFSAGPSQSGTFSLGLQIADGEPPYYVECEWRWQAQLTIGARFTRPLPQGILYRVLAEAAIDQNFF